MRHKSQKRWHEIILAQQASAMVVKEYCRRHDICRTSFYAWRKRLGMNGKPAPTAAKGFSGGFIRIRPPAQGTGVISIETPNGYRVQASLGAEGLKEALCVLRGL